MGYKKSGKRKVPDRMAYKDKPIAWKKEEKRNKSRKNKFLRNPR
jgi:hypothetical protein